MCCSMLCTSQKDVISLELETLPLVFPTLAACHLAETHAEKKAQILHLIILRILLSHLRFCC